MNIMIGNKKATPLRDTRIHLGLLLLVLVLLVSGCTRGSYSILVGEEDRSPTHYAMTYQRFNGYKEIELEVKQDEPVEVEVRIVSEEGRLHAWIAKGGKKEQASYEGRNIPTSTFTVTLSDPGTYTLHVEGDNHTGQFAFSWGAK
jgi:hypothetical protein